LVEEGFIENAASMGKFFLEDLKSACLEDFEQSRPDETETSEMYV
jgi:hypothetical protein